jgi:hypothetical protein
VQQRKREGRGREGERGEKDRESWLERETRIDGSEPMQNDQTYFSVISFYNFIIL